MQNVPGHHKGFHGVNLLLAVTDAGLGAVWCGKAHSESLQLAKGAAEELARRGRVIVSGMAKHAIAHNKVMVIDVRIVITGSFNFTKAAEESNAENLLVVRDEELAAKYAKNWQEHSEHSVPYERKAKE